MWRVAFALMALPALFLHEVVALLGPVIAFTAWWRSRQRNRTGLIAWEDLMQELTRDEAQFLGRMYLPFTNSDMSLLMTRDRRVQSIVINPCTKKWEGWRPTSALEWPKGWDYTELSPVTEGRSAPQRQGRRVVRRQQRFGRRVLLLYSNQTKRDPGAESEMMARIRSASRSAMVDFQDCDPPRVSGLR
jgi:hypothetical protein